MVPTICLVANVKQKKKKKRCPCTKQLMQDCSSSPAEMKITAKKAFQLSMRFQVALLTPLAALYHITETIPMTFGTEGCSHFGFQLFYIHSLQVVAGHLPEL